jgi:hypothetical protein
MAKQIVIDIKAVDQLTAPVRGMITNLLQMGDATIRMEKETSGAFRKIFGSVFSLKGAMVGLVGSLTAGLGARAAWRGLTSAAEEMDEINNQSIRLGIGVEQLSALKYQADLANVSFGALADGIFTAQKNVGQFITTGGGRAAPALRALNVQLKDGQGNVRSITDLLPDFIDRLNEIPDTTKRNFLAARIFGDGPEFIRLLAEGGDRLRFMNEEARKLGVVFTPEQIGIANEFRDALDRVSAAWFGMRAAAVVSAGPFLTGLLNRAASFIAAVPEMVSNLTTAVGDALGEDGPERDAAIAKFERLFDSIVGVLTAGVQAGASTLLGVTILASRSVIDFVFGDIGGRIERGIYTLIPQIVGWWATAARGAVSAFGLKGTMLEGALIMAEVGAEARAQFIAFEREQLGQQQTAMEKVAAFQRGFLSDLLPVVRQGAKAAREELRGQASEFLDATDALLGWVDAVARTGLAKLPKRPERDTTPKAPPTKLDDWLSGISQGWDEFENKINNTLELGRQQTLAFAETLTDDLTVAIVDVAGGVRSLEDSLKELGRSTFRMLSEMIVKFLLLRAVAGIASSFVGGGAAGAAQNPNTTIGGTWASDGGVIQPGRVERFALGGVSSGLPAMIMPGEMLVSPEGVRENRDVLARINRGERVGGRGIAAAIAGLTVVSAAAAGPAPVVNGLPFGYGVVVPGPNVERDIVPARLPVGTGVISKRGVAANDPAILMAIARGERVGDRVETFAAGGVAGESLGLVTRAPVSSGSLIVAGGGSVGESSSGAGASGGVHVTFGDIHITVQGGGTVDPRLAEQVKRGLMEGAVELMVQKVEARGSVRDRLRTGLTG